MGRDPYPNQIHPQVQTEVSTPDLLQLTGDHLVQENSGRPEQVCWCIGAACSCGADRTEGLRRVSRVKNNRSAFPETDSRFHFGHFCPGGTAERRSVKMTAQGSSVTPATSPATSPSSPRMRSGWRRPISWAPPPLTSPPSTSSM